MEPAAIADAPEVTQVQPAPARGRLLRRATRLAETIKVGSLSLVLPDGSTHRVAATEAPQATIVLHNPRALHRLLAGGGLGLADAYLEGWWQTPDLRAVMALALANEAEWGDILHAPFWLRWSASLREALHPSALFREPHDGVAPYGLGADFHAAWLDATMTQSGALFGGNDPSLEAAQLRKLHRLCRLLRLAPGIRVLDLACGWGSFAELAARDYGCSVLGITTSPSELEFAQARIKRAGLAHRVELRLQDYRSVSGKFDRIVAIETFDAVPEDYWPLYCKTVHDRLGQSGVAALQVVTISERLFDAYRTGADFITRNVAPGSMLPSKSRLRRAFAKASMAWGDEQWFGNDYAETLARWQANFQVAWPRIAALTRDNTYPCDERFKRLWEYYLAYRELGFRAGWMDVGQILIARNA